MKQIEDEERIWVSKSRQQKELLQQQKKDQEKAEKERIRAARLKVKVDPFVSSQSRLLASLASLQEDSQQEDSQQEYDAQQEESQQYDSQQQPSDDSQECTQNNHSYDDSNGEHVTVYEKQTHAAAAAGFSVPESDFDQTPL